VKLPNEKKLVGCKWVYKIKFNSNGTIEQYKPRLPRNIFTLTKMYTARILLSITVNQGWELYQMDVKNIFLQGSLEEEVYMTLSPGHGKEHDARLVCKLIKLIYGLKQSSRAWYEELSSHLIFYNFKINNVDHSLFIKIDHM
jgi:Reverse transcriptase (RNA-dependent DNA polymerase)